eukprot:1101908-Pyramimonas_sp.AAC.1
MAHPGGLPDTWCAPSRLSVSAVSGKTVASPSRLAFFASAKYLTGVSAALLGPAGMPIACSGRAQGVRGP